MFDYNLIFKENKDNLDNELASNRFKFADNLIQKGNTILDIGCANGNLMKHLTKEVSYLGMDISSEAIEDNSFPSIVGNAETFKLDRKFDRIVCLECLEHLEHPDKAIECMLNHLKENGIIIITVPKEKNFLDKTHIQFFYLNNLQELISKFTKNFMIRPIKKYDMDDKENMYSVVIGR